MDVYSLREEFLHCATIQGRAETIGKLSAGMAINAEVNSGQKH